MRKYKLLIAYDGTDYCGWQVQPNGVTIQQKIEEALHVMLREEIRVIGSGRTDAGVHALGQTAHFVTEQAIDLYRFMASINGLLPRDIRVRSVEEVAMEFHAQYSAIGKCYHYHIDLDKFQSPFKRLYSYHAREKIDLSILAEAAKLFIGTHDFTSFANERHEGSASKDPVRNLWRLDIVPEEGGICLEFEGDGFLYKMVRNIVGMLCEVASGKKEMAEISAVFAAKDRRRAGKAAPPEGLFLVRVDYPR